MSTEVQEETKVEGPTNPLDFLQTFKNAPTEEKLETIKASAPGGRLKLFTSSDGKRAYILRGISAFELEQLQNGMLKTVAPAKYEASLKSKLAAKCCVWTSVTPIGLLSEIEINAAGAGLADTLYLVISELSDYMDAPQILQFSADL